MDDEVIVVRITFEGKGVLIDDYSGEQIRKLADLLKNEYKIILVTDFRNADAIDAVCNTVDDACKIVKAFLVKDECPDSIKDYMKKEDFRFYNIKIYKDHKLYYA